MFKCKDCGTEYEIKPEYCDCGNNTFDEITPQPVVEQKEEINEIKPEIVVEKQVEKQIKKPVEKKSFDEQYPEFARFKSTLDPVSVVIFSICIILGLIIIFFVGNPAPQQTQTSKTEVKTENSDIPNSTSSFWNTSTSGVVSDVKKVETKPETKSITEIIKPKETVTQKTTQKKVTQKAKTVSTPVKQPSQNITVKPNNTNTNVQKSTATKTTANTGVSLDTYKTKLRNNIAKKIDFASVQGNGSCAVTFKINSSGTLVNRNFAVESGNDTLDGAVYRAVLATPTYTAPPSSYHNETLRLTVRMYNGNFEVSLN